MIIAGASGNSCLCGVAIDSSVLIHKCQEIKSKSELSHVSTNLKVVA